MWRSSLFWRLFIACSFFWLTVIAVLAAWTDTYSEEQRLVWKIAALAGTAVLFFALTLARFLAPPLKELADAANSIAKGNFGQKVYGAATPEVKELARAFNHMSEQLAVQFA